MGWGDIFELKYMEMSASASAYIPNCFTFKKQKHICHVPFLLGLKRSQCIFIDQTNYMYLH